MLVCLVGMKEEWRTAQGYFSGMGDMAEEKVSLQCIRHIEYYCVKNLIHKTVALEGLTVQW